MESKGQAAGRGGLWPVKGTRWEKRAGCQTHALIGPGSGDFRGHRRLLLRGRVEELG